MVITVLLNQHYPYKNILNLDINITNESGLTPLHIAAREGNLEVVGELVEFQTPKANINVMDQKDGWTPLHFAAYNNNLKVVKCLVKAGADLSLLSNTGKTALELAKKNSKVAEYLQDVLTQQKKQSSYAYSQNQTMWSSKNSESNINAANNHHEKNNEKEKEKEKDNTQTNVSSPKNSYSSSEDN